MVHIEGVRHLGTLWKRLRLIVWIVRVRAIHSVASGGLRVVRVLIVWILHRNRWRAHWWTPVTPPGSLWIIDQLVKGDRFSDI